MLKSADNSCMFSRVLILGLLVFGINRAVANVAGGGNEGPAVTVGSSGRNVVLANGIITATLQPNPIGLVSLKYKATEMVSRAGRHKFIYLSINADEGFDMLGGGVFSLTKQTPDMVDISCKRTYSPGNTNMSPCDVDTHFVLRRGMSGLYVYVIVDHPALYPALDASVWRMVWSLPQPDHKWLLEKIYVDAARHWEIPSVDDFDHQEATGIKEIVKLTTGAWKGGYDCKYMYSASYWDMGCYGFASDRNKIGAWYVMGSQEYFNDGPTHDDLNAETGLIEILFNQVHYGGSGLNIPKGEAWKKIYGPYLLYCNTNAAGGDACWADAKRQVQAEEAAWPYTWLVNNMYPSKWGRGTVTGRFIVKDPLKPTVCASNAWVGLSQPDPGGNWQFDSTHYQFWVHADADGNFSIPNVRPGTYVLSAFTTGALGEFTRTNVTVTAGETTTLGALTWQVSHPGVRIAWEIGVPDRTAKEFQHGDDYFRPYLWEKFSSELPNPLEYIVGVSDWSKDWNYVHSGYLKDGKWTPWKWRIHFTLTNAPANGTATLTIAYAGSNRGHTEIIVNDENKQFKLVRPAVDGGNALIREGIHAKYCVEQVTIPMSQLKSGANTITLSQSTGPSNLPFFHVMYDYLSLELPAAK